VSLRVGEGECVLLLGAIGSGKSTLLHLAAGLLRPGSGTVHVPEGSPGLVLQQPERQLVCATVFDEVAFGLRHGPSTARPSAADLARRARQALALVGLGSEIEARHPLRLSGGEQRRVAIACILALEPRLLLLDEPLAGLDTPGRRALIEVLRRLRAEGRSVLVASHTLAPFVEVADRVVALRDGCLVLDAPLLDTLRDPTLFDAAGLEPWPLATAARLLADRGWPTPLDPASPDRLADALLAPAARAGAGTGRRA
jgi:energy-coupling factor transporter ATP-binding protein EcfA2